jgi:hypothetical protein
VDAGVVVVCAVAPDAQRSHVSAISAIASNRSERTVTTRYARRNSDPCTPVSQEGT